ncbi:MAG: hypothetical protein HY259_14535, partial [Chloroflexi bacterium]|nr:hypothetical protein [Chloroflexota bacterium]
RLAFWLAATGGGFGWLTLTLGHPTADVLQAEIFPFLSVLANAHFPLASAALLWVMDALITPAGAPLTGRQAAQLTLGTLLLASTQAYGLVVAGGVAGLWAVLRWRKERRLPASLVIRLGWVAALAAPFLVYYGLALATNPSYAGWDRQNVTLSPPVWDYLLAGGLILLLALVGAVSLKDPKGFKNPSGLGSSPASDLRDDANAFLLIIWPVVTAALVYLPVAQQRRFALAAIAPLAVLAVRGLLSLEALARYALLRCRVNAEPVTLNVLLRPYHSYRRAVLVGFSALTPLTLLLVTMGALNQTPANLFLTQGEWDGLLYLRQVGTARRESVRQTAPSALVLAAPDMGLLIPAFAGQRVIYGHPVETIQAAARREEVRRFYMGMDAAEAEAFLKPVDYIFVGPREKALAGAPVRAPVIPSSYRVSFSEGDVIIYQKQGE